MHKNIIQYFPLLFIYFSVLLFTLEIIIITLFVKVLLEKLKVIRFAVGHFVVERFTVVVVLLLPRAAATAVSQVA